MEIDFHTYYNLPEKQNFSLSELEKLGVIKRSTALKAIHSGKLKAIKIMSKWFVPRTAILEFLNEARKEAKKNSSDER